ncbi:MAG: helix-turn-helix transcriptional regulator [Pygmaiobacter sp.]
MDYKNVDFSQFISLQPFWTAEKEKSKVIRSTETESDIAIVYDLHCDHGELDCVPGIGLIGVSFSEDPNQPRAICFGTLDHCKQVPLFGMKTNFMCHFFPGEFTRIFGVSCNELTNGELPLEDLISVGTYTEQFSLTQTFEERTELFQKFIATFERKAKVRDSQFLTKSLMREILQTNGDLRMKELELQTGYSARYLQRVLLENVGVSPKIMNENVRFQSALRLMYSSPRLTLTEIAQMCGFYDQSHFTKVFKEYTGIGPSVFFENLKNGKVFREGLCSNIFASNSIQRKSR